MNIMLHSRWQYVYWLAVFGFCGFLIKIRGYFVQESITTTAVTFVTILGVSVIATYIYGKIHWGIWNIVRTPENKWKCLECGNISRYLFNLTRADGHEFLDTCKGNQELKGCGNKIFACDKDKVKHSQIKRSQSDGKRYLVCTREQPEPLR